LTYIGYIDKVIEYLEYLDYPAMISEFNPMDIARPMIGTIKIFYYGKHSYRMCALVIWSMTMNHQIMPYASEQVKH
jgi:hypothetical protein